jgi:hypothetical protein
MTTELQKFTVVVKAGLTSIPKGFMGRLFDCIGPIFDYKPPQ